MNHQIQAKERKILFWERCYRNLEVKRNLWRYDKIYLSLTNKDDRIHIIWTHQMTVNIKWMIRWQNTYFVDQSDNRIHIIWTYQINEYILFGPIRGQIEYLLLGPITCQNTLYLDQPVWNLREIWNRIYDFSSKCNLHIIYNTLYNIKYKSQSVQYC